MDTGSHLLFGASLAGLAMLQPEVANSPLLAGAVLTATLVGSHAPDFDTVVRLKSYASYIRHHRGVTHSLPALLLWPLAIGGAAAGLFGVWEHVLTLSLWTMAAVIFHVFLDWLNVYGVQCFRPFSKQWHHLDILPLFDPFLFAVHSIGVIAWMTGAAEPGRLFLAVYLLTFAYIGVRAWHHAHTVRLVKKELEIEQGVCHIVPSLWWFHWQFVLETADTFYNGTIRFRDIRVKDVYTKDQTHPAIQATMGTDGVRAFLHFAQRVHVRLTEGQDGYVVHWRDLRFWHNHKLPFGVDVQLDSDLNVVSDRLGWTKKAWDPPYV
ncbi:metal-dependent hydrolase [Paenibacillus chartarius]|uniref:Metal-dependent hydrolase n=1 Tax=Paenibacillus chartarius TaxID=747481 RepID=A0ABV6DPY1_9BACL